MRLRCGAVRLGIVFEAARVGGVEYNGSKDPTIQGTKSKRAGDFLGALTFDAVTLTVKKSWGRLEIRQAGPLLTSLF